MVLVKKIKKKMENKKTVTAIRDFIITAEKSIKNAKKLLKGVLDENGVNMESEIDLTTSWLHSYNDENSKIIEWVFTWEEMLWVDENKYPVPVNYASKSKLVQWDKLKLTISGNGKMLYKQIEPIERETKSWLLTKENWKYQVVVGSDTYNVLTAAVTHFKADIWDNITVVIPTWKQATFAAIEALLPKEILEEQFSSKI